MKKRLLSLVLGCVAVSALGCNANYSQAKARELATSHTCDWIKKCGGIGSGETYANYDDCSVTWAGNWNNAWPTEECNNEIPPASLNSCLSFIDNTSCDDLVQIGITLLDQCSKKRVCNGNDGGS